MTPLLDRYLASIARELPKAQAADITAELRDNLLSEIEETEAGLGRPLTRKELEALLVDFGHPLLIAARYRKTQYLIGPEIFPFWRATLRVIFAIAAVGYLAGVVVRLATTRDPLAELIPQSLAPIWPGVLQFFGAVTAVFAIIERLGGKAALTRWSPRQLPPARAPGRSRASIVAQMTLSIVCLLWWIGLFRISDFLPAMPVYVSLAPIWAQLFWPVLGYLTAEILLCCLELARPAWIALNEGLTMAKSAAGLVLLIYILRAGHWIEVSAPHMWPPGLAGARANFDLGMKMGLICTAFILAIHAVASGWRLMRSRGIRQDGPALGPEQSGAG